jgi:NADH-quinone oxidoreductase subunit E
MASILERHRGQPDALISVLEEIQEHYGYLPRRALEHTAHSLRFPLSRVYGVATFYNLFRLSSPGRFVLRVCTGTACHVTGADAILEAVKTELGIAEEETTPDQLVTLQTIACMGACSLAPVVSVNDHVSGRMTPERAVELALRLRSEQTA